MRRRFACINDLPIKESERKYHSNRRVRADGSTPVFRILGL